MKLVAVANQVIDMKITVDRIENNIVVFQTEDGKSFEISKDIFPTLKEGDIITAFVDKSATESKKNEVNARLQNLFNK